MFGSAGRLNVAPGRGSSQWSSACEKNNKEVEVRVRVECAEDVIKGTTMTARATCRGRCEEGYFIKTQTLPADLMTLVLSHARKFTCAEVRNVRTCGVGFTHPSVASESPLPVWNKNQKSSLFIQTRCKPPFFS